MPLLTLINFPSCCKSADSTSSVPWRSRVVFKIRYYSVTRSTTDPCLRSFLGVFWKKSMIKLLMLFCHYQPPVAISKWRWFICSFIKRRLFANSQYFLSMSIPRPFRPVFIRTSKVKQPPGKEQWQYPQEK